MEICQDVECVRCQINKLQQRNRNQIMADILHEKNEYFDVRVNFYVRLNAIDIGCESIFS